jgi:hypothetical protein
LVNLNQTGKVKLVGPRVYELRAPSEERHCIPMPLPPLMATMTFAAPAAGEFRIINPPLDQAWTLPFHWVIFAENSRSPAAGV